jgi:hypothetical protein
MNCPSSIITRIKKQWGRLEGFPAVCFGGASKTVIS